MEDKLIIMERGEMDTEVVEEGMREVDITIIITRDRQGMEEEEVGDTDRKLTGVEGVTVVVVVVVVEVEGEAIEKGGIKTEGGAEMKDIIGIGGVEVGEDIEEATKDTGGTDLKE